MKRQETWYTANEYNRFEDEELWLTARLETVTRDIPLHQHEGVELAFITAGRGRVTVNGISYPILNGSFLSLNPYHFYKMKVEEEIRMYSLSCSLALPVSASIQSTSGKNVSDFLYEGAPVVWCGEERAARVCPVFEQVIREIREKNFCYEPIVRHMFMELEELFERYSLTDSMEGERKEASPEWRAVNQIMLTTHRPLSLEKLAAELEMEPEKLNQRIRIATGYSFRQLVHVSRMINVCALLDFQDLSVAFIAKLFCYSSLNTFYREFKKFKGMTPEEYRQRNTGEGTGPRIPQRGLALKMLVYIHNHFREHIDSETVQRAFHLSEGVIHKIMKSHFGKSFGEILTEVRIHYACMMLCSGDTVQICDIAYQIGFESVSTFNRAFKEHMRETAGEYRSAMSKNIRE